MNKFLKTAIVIASFAAAGIASAATAAEPAEPTEYIVTRISGVTSPDGKPLANYVFVREKVKVLVDSDEPQTLHELRITTVSMNPENLKLNDRVNVLNGRVVLSKRGHQLRKMAEGSDFGAIFGGLDG